MRMRRLAVVGGVLLVAAGVAHRFGVFSASSPRDPAGGPQVQIPMGDAGGKSHGVKRAPRVTNAAGSPDLLVGSESPPESGACAAIEYAGTGPGATATDSPEWLRLQEDFRLARGELVEWLHQNGELFTPEQMARMESEIRDTRLTPPLSQVEPDLGHRGIVAWSWPGDGGAQVVAGDGFLKLHQKNRVRAKFELVRALAQTWAPCAAPGLRAAAWDGMLKCLGLADAQAGCTAGAVSETAWASSTAVAALVSPPGCEVPAFQGEKNRACLDGFRRLEAVGYPIEKSENPQRKIASKAGEDHE